MSQINSITFHHTYNTAWYDNDNGMIDYYPSISGTLKILISKIKEKGAPRIITSTTNDDPKIPTERRVKQIAKACGYHVNNLSGMRTFRAYDDSPYESYVYEYELIKD